MGLTILFFAVLGIQIAVSIIAVLLLRDIRDAILATEYKLFFEEDDDD